MTVSHLSFNSRPHAEVDLFSFSLSPFYISFNSRPHAEVDFLCFSFDSFPSIFQLTTSRRGRQDSCCISCDTFSFQLTTSRRGRPYFILSPGCSRSFNSRPHAEVDCDSGRICFGQDLSTHDLTQRSTLSQYVLAIFSELSTHDLTQRSTTPSALRQCLISSFNSRPHAEVDMCGHRIVVASMSFQLTTSRRGRHTSRIDVSLFSVFQLTTSRRGRPAFSPEDIIGSPFNSRPHAEVDPRRKELALCLKIFQLTTSRRGRQYASILGHAAPCLSTHDLTQRSTIWKYRRDNFSAFQLTTSRRGRPLMEWIRLYPFSFQLTTSRRGRPFLFNITGLL